MTRFLACGGRDFADRALAYRELDAEHAREPITCLIEGDGTGLDRVARAWARGHGIEVLTFAAAWSVLTAPDARIKRRRDGSRYDANAGPRRNQRMIDVGRPTRGLAFPRACGRIGEGTADMIRRLRAAGIEPRIVSLRAGPAMERTYAIPDLHGRDDLLEAAIAAITERGGGTVVFLGDYVDRGPGSRQIINRLMAGPPAGQRWFILAGNHEQMMTMVARGHAPVEGWIQNGGGATLVSYGHPRSGRLDLSVIPAEHVAWIEKLPLLCADDHRVYVHAGVDPTIPLTEQSAKTLTWQRYPKGLDVGHGDLHVVHGHTPERDGPERFMSRTNLDTLSWYTGRLAVGVFEDDRPGGPVEVLWIEAASYEDLAKAATEEPVEG